MHKISIQQILVDCEWDDWVVSSCNATCGGGWIVKTRTEASSELNGGMPCNGSSTVTISCNEHDCPGKKGLILWSFSLFLGTLRYVWRT